METTFRTQKDTLIAALAGDMEITAVEGFRGAVLSHMIDGVKNVEIDARGLTYIDSTGLGAMVAVLKTVRQRGGSVKITGLRPHLYKLFEITALNRLFEIEVDDAKR